MASMQDTLVRILYPEEHGTDVQQARPKYSARYVGKKSAMVSYYHAFNRTKSALAYMKTKHITEYYSWLDIDSTGAGNYQRFFMLLTGLSKERHLKLSKAGKKSHEDAARYTDEFLTWGPFTAKRFFSTRVFEIDSSGKCVQGVSHA